MTGRSLAWTISRSARMAAILLVSSLPSLAQEAPPESSRPWQLTVTPYAWGMSLSGDTVARGVPGNVDIGLGTILENLDVTGMIDIRLRHDRFEVFTNFVYGKIGSSQTRVLAPGTVQAKITSTMTFVDFGAAYSFDPIPLGTSRDDGSPKVTLSPYVGGRYSSIDLKLRVNSIATKGGIDWVDPIIGLRALFDFDDRWSAMLAGDVGGFGLGSDFAWNIQALAGYRFGLFAQRDAAVFLGYRALGQTYSEGSGSSRTEWDTVSHGPLLGLSVTF